MILAPNLCFRTIPTTCTTIKHQREHHQLNQVTQTKTKVCECFDFHKELIPYGKAWSWQKQIVKQKKALLQKNEDCPDTLIILQHNPVYTLGTGSWEKYLNFDIKEAPFDVYRTERGGEVTYHGPGQIVMYLIINLRNHKMDLHWYLRALEEVVIRVLSSTFSIKASRIEGLTGVWVDRGNRHRVINVYLLSEMVMFQGSKGSKCIPTNLNSSVTLSPFDFYCIKYVPRQQGIPLMLGLQLKTAIGHYGNQKLAAIGVRVSQWITYHGLAINVTTDLTPFSWIVPCGLQDRQVESIKGLLQEFQSSTRCGEAVTPSPGDYQLIDISYKSLIKEFSEVFNLEIHQKTILMSEF